jgi:nucleoside-diphosphate-sugar epimerase
MKILLTGGTGAIGSIVLRRLIDGGHDVLAVVRSEVAAKAVEQGGAKAALGDITNQTWLVSHLADSDGAIHTASPGDTTSPSFDESVLAAVKVAYTGTGKPYVHTSGIWVYGSGLDITEASPLHPPQLTSWRIDHLEQLKKMSGLHVMVVVPGVVYGYGKGLPNVIVQSPLAANGGLTLIGDGTQHWTTVHADDLANLYVSVLEKGTPGSSYLAVSECPTVLELAQTIGEVAGITAEPEKETVEASRKRLGAMFADALLLDQHASSAKAIRELDWKPSSASLIDEFRAGGYTRI